jgi:nitrite reductase/ring-hydroxylating ferredoxin subunit
VDTISELAGAIGELAERSMTDINIGSAAEFDDPGRKIIDANGVEVGVFKLAGEFFAYLNVCPHIGGPACQGKIIAKVDEVISADRTSMGLKFSKTQINVVCPWHGYEFDIRTGSHPGNPRIQLARVKVEVQGGDVVLSVPNRPL